MKQLIILLYILTLNAFAATYYVRKDGNDANTGTANTAEGAWLTLTKASTAAAAGDTINIGPGTWDENVILKRGGTAGAPFIWNGAGKDLTICSRFQNNITSTNIGHPHVHFKNMTISWQIETMGHYTLVENCKFTWTTYRQLWIKPLPGYTGPDGAIVRTSDFIGVGGAAAVQMDGNDGLIDRCFFSTDNGGDAIYLNGYRNIVRGNRFINWNRPAGSTQHTDLIQAWSNNGEISQDHLIENNFAKDCVACQIGNIDNIGEPPRIKNWTFRNNIFIRVSNPINVYAPGMKFYNNTFYRTANGAGSPILFRAGAKGIADDCEAFNNIYYKGGALTTSNVQGFPGFVNSVGYAITTFSGNNNLVIGDGAGTVKAGNWAFLGSNSTSLNGVDPLFVNSTNPMTMEDLRLLPGSPAIGFGANLSSSFTTDFNGDTRVGAWSLGALQYNDNTPQPSDTTPPTITAATVNSTGNQLTITFSESVFNTTATHYTLSNTTLSNIGGAGTVRTFTCNPPIIVNTTPTLGYTSGAGRTSDSAGNLLQTVSGIVVTNNSIIQAEVPRRPGRKGVKSTSAGTFSR